MRENEERKQLEEKKQRQEMAKIAAEKARKVLFLTPGDRKSANLRQLFYGPIGLNLVKSVHKRADANWPICGHQELK